MHQGLNGIDRDCSLCTNAVMRSSASGSSAARFMSTPIRRTRSACCDPPPPATPPRSRAPRLTPAAASIMPPGCHGGSLSRPGMQGNGLGRWFAASIGRGVARDNKSLASESKQHGLSMLHIGWGTGGPVADAPSPTSHRSAVTEHPTLFPDVGMHPRAGGSIRHRVPADLLAGSTRDLSTRQTCRGQIMPSPQTGQGAAMIW